MGKFIGVARLFCGVNFFLQKSWRPFSRRPENAGQNLNEQFLGEGASAPLPVPAGAYAGISYKPSSDGPCGAALSLDKSHKLFTPMRLCRQAVFDIGLKVALPYRKEGNRGLTCD